MRIFSTVASALVLTLLASGPALADWSGATADQYISYLPTPGRTVYSPAFAAGPNGELYAVWVQGSSLTPPLEIYFSRSTDNGTTWSGTGADQQISANDGDKVYNGGIFGARRIDVETDSQGRIFVVWPENYIQADFDTTIEIMMVMSTDGGTNWTHSDFDFAISDTNSTPTANDPKLDIDQNDNVHVVWQQNHPTSGVAEIFYSVSTDHGATWSGRTADRVISFDNGHASFRSDIHVDQSGNIHVAWRESWATGDFRLLYGVSTNGGTTFSSETGDSILSYSPYDIVYPRLATGPSAGYVHIIYAQNDTAVYVGTTNGGVSWTETQVWGGTSFDMYGPEIGVTSTGILVAIIEDEYPSSTNRQIWASYSYDNGQNWSAVLDPVSYYDFGTFDRAYYPTIVRTAGDVLHVVYSTNYPSSSNSYQEVCHSFNSGLTPTTGALIGTVTELDGTTPIAGVQVQVFDDTPQLVGTDTTNVNGYYAFQFTPGTYSAQFSKYTHHDSSATGIVIVVNEVDTVDISLRPQIQGTIGGTVYEGYGMAPLPDVRVRTYSNLPEDPRDTTDVSGNYSLSLYPTTYDVRFQRTQFLDTTVTGIVLPEAGNITLNVNMRWAIPHDDIQALSLVQPNGAMIIGYTYQPEVRLRNNGHLDQTFNVNLRILDPSLTEVYNQTVQNAVLDSLATGNEVFSTDFTPLDAGDYSFTMIVSNPGDENLSNDTLSATLTAYAHVGYGGPDAFGYKFRDNTVACGPEFAWIDIKTTGIQIEPNMHFFMSDPLYIGFSFPFYGTSYDSMWVNSHGSLHIGMRDVWLSGNTCPVPNSSTPHAPMVMVYWDQLEVLYEIGHGVYYQTFTDPESDFTVVQWLASPYGRDDTLEFEVILYEDGSILYQYNDIPYNAPTGQGQSATIGLEYDVLPSGISYLCNDDNPGNRLVESRAIRWYTAVATTGDLGGYVTQVGTGTPVDGATVEVVGTGYTDATDLNGFYEFCELAPSSYNVRFTHPDYPETTVTGVSIVADQLTVLDLEWTGGPQGYAFLPGDANMHVGLWPPQAIGADITYIVNYLRNNPINVPCLLDALWASGDVNGSCAVDGSDVIRFVNYLRGAIGLTWCPGYDPMWPTPQDLPPVAPPGWPNCENPLTAGKTIPTDQGK